MVGAWKLSLVAAVVGLLRGGEAMRPQQEEATRSAVEASGGPDFAAEIMKISKLLPKDRSQLRKVKTPAEHSKIQALRIMLPLLGALTAKTQHHAPAQQSAIAAASPALEQPEERPAASAASASTDPAGQVLSDQSPKLAKQFKVSDLNAHASSSALAAPKADERPPSQDFMGELGKLSGLVASILAKKKGAAPAALAAEAVAPAAEAAAPAAEAAMPAQVAASSAGEKIKALNGLMARADSPVEQLKALSGLVTTIAAGRSPRATASLVENLEDSSEVANSEGPPPLTKESARALLTKAINTFKQSDNKDKLEGLLKECEGADPAQAPMMMMMKLLPAVQQMMGPALEEFGYTANDLMQVTMQIQAFGPQDESIAADVAKLMKAVQGDLSDLLA